MTRWLCRMLDTVLTLQLPILVYKTFFPWPPAPVSEARDPMRPFDQHLSQDFCDKTVLPLRSSFRK